MMDRWPHQFQAGLTPPPSVALTSGYQATDPCARSRIIDYLDRERIRILSLPFSAARGYALLDISTLLKDAVEHHFLSAAEASSIRRTWIERYCEQLSVQLPQRDRDALLRLQSEWRKIDRRQQFEQIKHALSDGARRAVRAVLRIVAGEK